MSVRDRRIEHEWAFLQRLAECNSRLISAMSRNITPNGTVFEFVLTETSAFSGSAPILDIVRAHSVSLRFAPFFPAVPIEAFVRPPVFHPNVHPTNGFVCLWDRFSSGDSTLNAVFKLQRVLAWELYNATSDHLMQPEALAWSNRLTIPLAYTRLQIPPDLESECGYRRAVPKARRTRLSEISISNEDQPVHRQPITALPDR